MRLRTIGYAAIAGMMMALSISCSARFAKTGATDLEWERDRSECERGASSSFYERCLQSRGWRKL